MGTRSNIGLVNSDGSIETIYTHWDGYPEYVGVQLALNYKDEETVKALLGFGDRSSLRGAPSAQDSYAERGEVVPATKWESFDAYYKGDKAGAEFVYLFKDGEWYIYSVNWEDESLTHKGVISRIHVEIDVTKVLELPTLV